MGNRLVTAPWAVDMAGIMTPASMIRGAAIGIVGGDVDHVLVDMIFMWVMKVTIVQIVDMAAVPLPSPGPPSTAGPPAAGW